MCEIEPGNNAGNVQTEVKGIMENKLDEDVEVLHGNPSCAVRGDIIVLSNDDADDLLIYDNLSLVSVVQVTFVHNLPHTGRRADPAAHHKWLN